MRTGGDEKGSETSSWRKPALKCRIQEETWSVPSSFPPPPPFGATPSASFSIRRSILAEERRVLRDCQWHDALQIGDVFQFLKECPSEAKGSSLHSLGDTSGFLAEGSRNGEGCRKRQPKFQQDRKWIEHEVPPGSMFGRL